MSLVPYAKFSLVTRDHPKAQMKAVSVEHILEKRRFEISRPHQVKLSIWEAVHSHTNDALRVSTVQVFSRPIELVYFIEHSNTLRSFLVSFHAKLKILVIKFENVKTVRHKIWKSSY